MSDEVAPQGGAPKQFEPYNALTINIGVWFSPFSFNERTSLSLNYTRGSLILDFHRSNGKENKEVISKKLPLNQAYVLNYLIKMIVRSRLNVAEKCEGFAAVPYSAIARDEAAISNFFYNTKEKQMTNTGEVQIHTVEINGVNRMALTASNGKPDSKPITVIFADDNNSKLVKRVTQFSVIDPVDVSFYRLGLEIEKALGKSFEYAGFDKLYQMLLKGFHWKGDYKPGQQQEQSGSSNYQKKPWQNNGYNNNGGGYKKPYQNNYQQNSPRPVEVKITDTKEEGSNAFDVF
jgi:hypothetical protein